MNICEKINDKCDLACIRIVTVSNLRFLIKMSKVFYNFACSFWLEFEKTCDFIKEYEIDSEIVIVSNHILFQEVTLKQNLLSSIDNCKINIEDDIIGLFYPGGKLAYVILDNFEDSMEYYHKVRYEIYIHMSHRLEYSYKFVFHASAAQNLNNVWVMLGESKSGKSTSFMNLICHGWTGITDDKIIIYIDEEEKIIVESFYKSVHLRKDTVNRTDVQQYLLKNAIEIYSNVNNNNFVDKYYVFPLTDINNNILYNYVFYYLDWVRKENNNLVGKTKLLNDSCMLISQMWKHKDKQINRAFFKIIVAIATKYDFVLCNSMELGNIMEEERSV